MAFDDFPIRLAVFHSFIAVEGFVGLHDDRLIATNYAVADYLVALVNFFYADTVVAAVESDPVNFGGTHGGWG